MMKDWVQVDLHQTELKRSIIKVFPHWLANDGIGRPHLVCLSLVIVLQPTMESVDPT